MINVSFLVSTRDSQGGIGRLALYLDREFSERMPDVKFKIIPTRWSERRILKHISTLPALLAFVIKCAMAAHQIVHINVAPRGSTYRKYLYWLVARAFGAKTVIHLHGSGYDQFYRSQARLLQGITRHFFCRADHVVVLGEYWREFMAQEIGVARERITVVYNGVPEPKESAERKWEPPLIASMGLVGERKGTDVLIKALSSLPTSVDWRAIIGGNGEIEKYRSIAESAGLGAKVQFLGWVGEEDVDRWLNRASLFVLPSRAENQPVAILEAMARGVPVIATSIGAIPEQVIDGETGLLIPAGQARSLQLALQNLLESPDCRAAMSVAARKRFQEHFSIERCAEALRAVYQSLPEAGPDGRARK